MFSAFVKNSFWLVACLLFIGHALAIPTPIELLARTQVASPEVKFSHESKAWLNNKETLTVAVWGKSHPPIYMDYERDKLEGIAADYLNILGQAFNKKINILHYANIEEAHTALENHDVDMLAFYNPATSKYDDLLISKPYLLDHAVIVHKSIVVSSRINTLENIKLAFVGDDYLHILLNQNYPAAQLQNHLYYSEAMAALAYNTVDALWMNAATASFLMNKGVEAQAKMTLSDLAANANISFAALPNHAPLIDAINNTLSALPLTSRTRISNNWGLDPSFVMQHNPLALSREELEWIAKHPQVPVSLPAFMAPISFLDEANQPNGYVPALLKRVAERTGIQFTPTVAGSAPIATNALLKHGVIAAAIKNVEPQPGIDFSRSYVVSPRVLVVDSRASTETSLKEMAGKRIAVVRESGIVTQLARQYPNVKFIEVDDVSTAFSLLSNKKIDGAISAQISADYLINKQFYKQLFIANSVEIVPAHITMVVGSDNPILLNIINKALVDLSPQTLQRDLTPWQNYQAPPQVTVWDKYSNYLFYSITLTLAISLIILWRNRYLSKIIGERTRYEQQLENQLQFIRTLIDDSPVALYVRDKNSRMVQCNNTYLQFLRTTSEAVTGKTLHESAIFTPESNRRFQRLYDQTLCDAEPTFTTQEIVTLGGWQAQVYHWTLPYRDHAGNIDGIIGGFIDITERDKLMFELNKAKSVADRANASKSIFLSQMSHEIRTPLNALIGLLELETRKQSTPEQREQNIAVAWSASKSLLSLVGDILDLAKIESGVHDIRYVPLSLSESVQSVVTLFTHTAAEKKIELKAHWRLNQPVILFDATLLNQILSNLVSNAIKFTDSGHVEVNIVETAGITLERREYVLSVSDTGTGLNEYQKQAIFEPFVQVEDAVRNRQGTGLGLSICRQLAERLGGHLSVESEPGKGSTFSFRFSADISHEKAIAKEASSPERDSGRKHILIVDDHAPNRLVLSQQLEYAGHHVVAVESAQQALLRWEMAVPTFDIVITDCNMPGMNGFDLVTALREKERQRGVAQSLMFGLTALAENEAQARGKQAGMTDCLFKPIPLDTLLTHISSASAPKALTE